MKILLYLVIILALFGCNLTPEIEDSGPLTVEGSEETTWISFEEISEPYFKQYGEPEEVNKYTSTDYSTVDWWWWSKGFEVSFINTTYDEVYGWRVDSTYEFDPIAY